MRKSISGTGGVDKLSDGSVEDQNKKSITINYESASRIGQVSPTNIEKSPDAKRGRSPTQPFQKG